MDKRHLFGTSGIRGPADSLFTDQFSFDIGRTFVIFLDSHKQTGAIAIGMDPRGSSPRIVKAIESGILYQGREVYDEGPTPVPSMNNILLTSDLYKGSIMVSGSHIKSDLNGIKFFFCKEEILKEHEAQIEKIYFSIQEKIKFRQTSEGIHYEENAKNDYQEKLLGLAIKPYPKWSVVIDPGDGAQSDVMPFVLKTVGLEVIEMNATIQGEFFARDTEVQKDFLDLKNKVKEESADFGVGRKNEIKPYEIKDPDLYI